MFALSRLHSSRIHSSCDKNPLMLLWYEWMLEKEKEREREGHLHPHLAKWKGNSMEHFTTRVLVHKVPAVKDIYLCFSSVYDYFSPFVKPSFELTWTDFTAVSPWHQHQQLHFLYKSKAETTLSSLTHSLSHSVCLSLALSLENCFCFICPLDFISVSSVPHFLLSHTILFTGYSLR